MRSKRFILACLLLLPAIISAKKAAPAITPEQEQQFLYYFYASRQAIEQQDYSKALLLLDFCEQLNPNDGLIKDNLGVIYAALGEADKAEALFAQAYKLAPDDCWQHYADHLLRADDKAKAIRARKIVENVQKQHPKDADIADYLMQIYMHNKQWKKALAMQDKVDALTGYDANSALNRYRIYYQWEKGKEAVAEIDKYLAEDPTNVYFLLLRADIYVNTKQYLPAFAICEQLAKLMPLSEQEFGWLKRNTYCSYYVSLIKAEEGDDWFNKGESDRAYECYEQSLSLLPQNAHVLNNYAYNLAIYGGDIKKAERMSEQTIKQEPDNPIYLDTYGWILHLQGQDLLAAFYLKKALENVQDEENRVIIKNHLDEIEKSK